MISREFAQQVALPPAASLHVHARAEDHEGHARADHEAGSQAGQQDGDDDLLLPRVQAIVPQLYLVRPHEVLVRAVAHRAVASEGRQHDGEQEAADRSHNGQPVAAGAVRALARVVPAFALAIPAAARGRVGGAVEDAPLGLLAQHLPDRVGELPQRALAAEAQALAVLSPGGRQPGHGQAAGHQGVPERRPPLPVSHGRPWEACRAVAL
mmetsp:Transcript_81889/g.240383  ORF Transcript_81889/g.240383 Transcript_81889/m.240383 type:complete len:210 (+) Transcript_81889:1-630(+)